MRNVMGLIAAIFAAIVSLPRPGESGELVPCCNRPGDFCSLDWSGGRRICEDVGGELVVANACTSVPDCGVAYQLEVEAKAVIEIPPLRFDVCFGGEADVIDVEIIQVDLWGEFQAGQLRNAVRLETNRDLPSLGGMDPPDHFPADSLFDFYFELEFIEPVFPYRRLRNRVPARLEAPAIFSFPPLGTPYRSRAPVPLVDPEDRPVGRVEELQIEFQSSWALCHWSEENGIWEAKLLPEASARAHLQHHDDAIPGRSTAISAMPLTLFCSPAETICPGWNKSDLDALLEPPYLPVELSCTSGGDLLAAVFDARPGGGIIATQLDAGRQVKVAGFGKFGTRNRQQRKAKVVSVPVREAESNVCARELLESRLGTVVCGPTHPR